MGFRPKASPVGTLVALLLGCLLITLPGSNVLVRLVESEQNTQKNSMGVATVSPTELISKVLLLGHFPTTASVSQVIEWKKAWKTYFAHILVVGNWTTSQRIELASQHVWNLPSQNSLSPYLRFPKRCKTIETTRRFKPFFSLQKRRLSTCHNGWIALATATFPWKVATSTADVGAGDAADDGSIEYQINNPTTSATMQNDYFMNCLSQLPSLENDELPITSISGPYSFRAALFPTSWTEASPFLFPVSLDCALGLWKTWTDVPPMLLSDCNDGFLTCLEQSRQSEDGFGVFRVRRQVASSREYSQLVELMQMKQ